MLRTAAIALVPLGYILWIGAATAASGAEESVAGLIDQFLAEKNYSARFKLQQTLEERGAEVVPVLMHQIERTEDAEPRRLLIPLLGKFPHRGVANRLAAIGADDTDAACRRAAISALGDFGDEALPLLERMLGTGLSDLDKTQVARSIGATGHERSPALLVKAVRDHARSAQGAEFARVLGYHHPEVALEVLPGMTGKVEPPLLGQIVFLLHLYAGMLPDPEASALEARIAQASKKLLSEFSTNIVADRTEIAKGLGALRVAAAEPRLIELCQPTDVYVDAYLWALSRIGSPTAFAGLESFLGGEDPPKYGGGWATRGIAAAGGDDASARLITLLGAENDDIVTAAVDELRARGVADAAPQMGETLLREGRGRTVKVQILTALRELKNPAVAYPVARLASGDDAYLRGPALMTLAELPGAAATDELLTLMDNAKLSTSDKGHLYRGLATRDADEVVDFFLDAMDDAALRGSVHQAMHAAGSTVHVPALIARYEAADEARQGHIVDLLGAAGDPVALPVVIAAMKPAPLRSTAYRALREIGDRAAIDAVLPYLASGDPVTFHGAFQTVMALDVEHARIESRELAAAVERLLKELDEDKPETAMDLLGRSSSPRAREALVQRLIREPDGERQVLAARAIAKAGVDAALAEEVLSFLPSAPVAVQLPLLDALLCAEDRGVDQATRKLARRASPPMQAALEAYALRSGLESSTKKLQEKVTALGAELWDSDPARRADADRVLEWVTGESWPEERRGRDRAPPTALTQVRGGEIAAPITPVIWQVQRVLHSQEDAWKEDADFAAAVRSQKAKALNAHLTRYPDGRHQEEARRRLQLLGDQ